MEIKLPADKYPDSHAYWAAVPDHVKKKMARQHPQMSEQGLRLFAWRRRKWEKLIPDVYPCQCGMAHKRDCPNAIAERLNEERRMAKEQKT
jgi:hypothetical protein